MTAKSVDQFYWLPYCSTCQKAEAFLKEQGITISHTIDVKTEPVSKETLRAIAERLGGVEALFSKRAMKYRSMGLDKMTLTEDQMLQYMTEEYTFIKRPVLVAKDKVLAGFSAKQYEAWIKS